MTTTPKRCFFSTIAYVVLLCSCSKAFWQGAQDELLTTNNATYKDIADGMKIILAEKGGGVPENVGFISKKGEILKEATFKYEKTGTIEILHGVEMPVDYVKISNEPKARPKRSTGPTKPSKYKGTWLGFMPSDYGLFQRMFLDFDEEGKVKVFKELRSADDGDASRITTDIDTEIKGDIVKNLDNLKEYKIRTDIPLESAKGYTSSFSHIIGRLEKKEKDGKEILEVKFKTSKETTEMLEMFEFKSKDGNIDKYVGYGIFAKNEKEGKEKITLDIDYSAQKFTLNVPKEIEIIRKFK